MVVALASTFLVGTQFAPAHADAPDVTSVTAVGGIVVNPDGTRTVTIRGRWAWTTHTSDCNTNRFGVGWAVDWHDPAAPGNYLATLDGADINVGTPTDNVVHYSTNAPYCGAYDPLAGYNTGPIEAISHTYPAGVDPIRACVVTYDIHLGGGPNAIRPGDLVAGGAGHNDDNSVEDNGQTPAGNVCFEVTFPGMSTEITTVLTGGSRTGASIDVPFGTAVTDRATLVDATANAAGTVTYTVYSDDTCATEVFDAGTKVVVNGVAPASDPFTATTAGTYYWQVEYTPAVGDQVNQAATSECTDEVLTVDAVQNSGTTTTVKIPNELPRTGGGNTSMVLAIGALLLVIGGGFLARTPRRPHSAGSRGND